MLPNLESLRCFSAAATYLNFRIAAQSVALSPAAFGERIRQLEEILNATLFTRTTRKVQLTQAGEALRPSADALLAEAGRLSQIVHHAKEPVPYELTLGTRFELGLSWLVQSLSALKQKAPKRTIHLFFGDSHELVARVERGLLDCAVTSTRIVRGGVNYVSLHKESYVLLGNPKQLRAQAFRHSTHASSHTLLDIDSDLPLFRYFLDATDASQIWEFASHEYLGTIAAIRLRLLEVGGIAVLPHYFVKNDLATKKLVALFPRIELAPDYFRLIWRKGDSRQKEFSILAQHLKDLPIK